jgi:hypothetical protein
VLEAKADPPVADAQPQIILAVQSLDIASALGGESIERADHPLGDDAIRAA